MRVSQLMRRLAIGFALISVVLVGSLFTELSSTVLSEGHRLGFYLWENFDCAHALWNRWGTNISDVVVSDELTDLFCNANFTFIVTSSARRSPIMPLTTTPCLNYLQIDNGLYRVFRKRAGNGDASARWIVNASLESADVLMRTCRQYSVLCRALDFFFLLQNVGKLFPPDANSPPRDFVVFEDDVIPCEGTFEELLRMASQPRLHSRFDVPFVALAGWKALLLRADESARLRAFDVAIRKYLDVTTGRSVDIDTFFRQALKGQPIYFEVAGEYVRHPIPTCINGIMHTGSADPVICERKDQDFVI
jgi:hypothetical protein